MDTESEILEATTERAKTIRAINTETVHKICSGQVIFSILHSIFCDVNRCHCENCLCSVGGVKFSDCC